LTLVIREDDETADDQDDLERESNIESLTYQRVKRAEKRLDQIEEAFCTLVDRYDEKMDFILDSDEW